MKNKKIIIYSIFVFVIFSIISLVPLTDAIISDDTLTIKIYNIDNISNSDDKEITFRIDFNSSGYEGNDHSYTFKINISTLSENENLLSQDIFYIVQSEAEDILNIDYKLQAESCIEEKTGLNIGYNKCTENLEGCKNNSNYKTDYDACTLDIKKNELDMQSKNKEIEDLNKEKTDTKNEKWFWAIGGAIFGGLGLLFKQGKLGGNPKDTSESEFNRNQAG